MWADAAVARFAQVARETEQLVRVREVAANELSVQVGPCTSATTPSGQMSVVVDMVNREEQGVPCSMQSLWTLWTLTLVAVCSVDLHTEVRSPLPDALVGAMSDFWTEQIVPTFGILPLGSSLGPFWIAAPPCVVSLARAVSALMPIPSTHPIRAPESIHE